MQVHNHVVSTIVDAKNEFLDVSDDAHPITPIRCFRSMLSSAAIDDARKHLDKHSRRIKILRTVLQSLVVGASTLSVSLERDTYTEKETSFTCHACSVQMQQ